MFTEQLALYMLGTRDTKSNKTSLLSEGTQPGEEDRQSIMKSALTDVSTGCLGIPEKGYQTKAKTNFSPQRQVVAAIPIKQGHRLLRWVH